MSYDKHSSGTLTAIIFLAGLLQSAGDAQANPAADAARAWRQDHEQQILDEYLELLRIPNVSQDLPNVRRNAEHLLTMMRARGLNPRLLESPNSSPLVYGELLAPGASATYVFYAHYDGQPVAADDWASPPFEPLLRTTRLDLAGQPVNVDERRRGLKAEWRIYARSAADDKAPIMAMMAALDALKAAGIQPRANLKFVFEGEEEMGSPHLREHLAAHREVLRGDVWLMCDGPEHASGRPTLVFGARGTQSIDITVYGANRELHSGHYGNWAPNPALLLARLVASMRDAEGRVLIEHFYDGVVPLTPGERAALANVPDNDAQEMRDLGLARVLGKGTRLEGINQPALNIDGLASGHTGAEGVNAIPASATARLDVRLVKGMDREQTVGRVIEHVRRQGFFVTDTEPDAELRLKHAAIARVVVNPGGYNAARTSLDLPIAKHIVATLESVRKPLVLLPTIGGSLPLSIIEEALGVPTITVSIVNHDNNQHAKDENLRLQNLWSGMETLAGLLTMP
ncbi:MAG TPA: M20/M25/M40 family metallo-hydrolase [Steroidobacteraceae bacterium]|nr:M20/M25/M40 family metallo-hydrolase [Steroidobacteraceae bacterium]